MDIFDHLQILPPSSPSSPFFLFLIKNPYLRGMQKHWEEPSNSTVFYFIVSSEAQIFHNHAVFHSSKLWWLGQSLLPPLLGAPKHLSCSAPHLPMTVLVEFPFSMQLWKFPYKMLLIYPRRDRARVHYGGFQDWLPRLPGLELCCCCRSLAADPSHRPGAAAASVPACHRHLSRWHFCKMRKRVLFCNKRSRTGLVSLQAQ